MKHKHDFESYDARIGARLETRMKNNANLSKKTRFAKHEKKKKNEENNFDDLLAKILTPRLLFLLLSYTVTPIEKRKTTKNQ